MPFKNGRHFSSVAFCRSMVSVMSGSRMGGGCVNKAGIPGRGWLESGFMAVVMVVLAVGINKVEVGRFLVLDLCAFGNRTFRGLPMSGIKWDLRYFGDLTLKEL